MMIDSTGKPGIPGVGIGADVVVELIMLEVVEADKVDGVTNVVAVDTVATTIAVDVAVNTPPNAENRSIVERGVW
jgi:hypothetical protein